jgi:hypothetical protein
LLFYAGAIGFAHARKDRAVQEYAAIEKSDVIQKHGGMDAGYVGVVTQLRVFMETPRKQIEQVRATARIVAGISTMKEAKIVELHTPPDQRRSSRDLVSGPTADASLILSVPKSNGTATEQANEIIHTLADTTHISWRPVPRVEGCWEAPRF